MESTQETVEPILDMYKPPGLIKKIYFRRLTFGNAPIRIDNVWVDKQTPDELVLEVLCTPLRSCWGFLQTGCQRSTDAARCRLLQKPHTNPLLPRVI